jgi:Fe-S-cluster-containing hydrogenase component 2
MKMAQARGYEVEELPWLMVSLNDGEDPHFRKAEFDAARCPDTCPRPCEAVCPVKAIVFESVFEGHASDGHATSGQATNGQATNGAAASAGFSGVIESLCYGCGRCLTICPIQNIAARSYVSTPTAVAPLVLAGVDAVEIHTQIGRLEHFRRLWQAILPYLDQLKLISISCPDGEGLIDYLWTLYDLISPLPCALIWQTDGRPMSGDIGDGATRAAIRLGQKVLAANLPGHVQLAGGTNHHTVAKLSALGLLNPADRATVDKATVKAPEPELSKPELKPRLSDHLASTAVLSQPYIAGVAYGSYARAILSPVLDLLEPAIDLSVWSSPSGPYPSAVPSPVDLSPCSTMPNSIPLPQSSPAVRALQLEDNSQFLWQAVATAYGLVADLKQPRNSSQSISTALSGQVDPG